MIYQVGIGEFDNCYIITGGITGLSSFEPTLVNGTETPAIINIDSEDDTIFAAWKKQSMQVNLIKENESDFQEILSSVDNDTYGILVEDGELELSGGDVVVTSGGILKFIGRLTLETYTEQYRNTSVVSFNFFDCIGRLEETTFNCDLFKIPFTDLLAHLLSGSSAVMNESHLKIEWPYNIDTDNLPHYLLRDVRQHIGRKKIDVLTEELKDLGLQLFVDFEDACIKVISVTDHVLSTVTYHTYTIATDTTINGVYYSYTPDSIITENKTAQHLGTSSLELLRNETILSLERVASSVKAKNVIDIDFNMVTGGEIVDDFINEDIATNNYSPLGDVRGATVYDQLVAILDAGNLYGVLHPLPVWISEYKSVVVTPSNITSRVICTTPIAIQNVSTGYSLLITYDIAGLFMVPDLAMYLYVTLTKYTPSTALHTYWDGSSWETFTDANNLINAISHHITSSDWSNNGFNATIVDDEPDCVIMLNFLVGNSEISDSVLLRNISIKTTLGQVTEYPATITLNTSLTGNNRKIIELEPKLMNVPDVPGAENIIKNLVQHVSLNYPLTVDYKGLSQTMLAHLSDQYGWQYNGNRWNIDGVCKGIPYINLMGQFMLDDKFLMILNGSYDARRKEFDGKFGHVVVPDDSIDSLLQDNYIPFTWDNGNYIMIN